MESTDPIPAIDSALRPMLMLQAWYDEAGEGSRLFVGLVDLSFDLGHDF
jgi:hypothetical protein